MKQIGPTAPRELAGMDAWELPGLIGAELAHHVSPAIEMVQRLQAAGCMSDAEAGALAEAVDHLRRIALTSQQITRLASGRMQQSHERLDLSAVLRHVLAENESRFRRHGIEVESHLQAIEVVTDAGLLVALCEAALDCAAYDGQRLQLWLEMAHWPEHAVLTVRSRPHCPEPGGRTPSHSLHWIYLCRLAEATGVPVRRAYEPEFVQITIDFPRTAKRLAALAAAEAEAGDALGGVSTLGGRHLLLVSTDRELAREVERVCRELCLVLDVVGDCSQAHRFCRLELPDLIVLDESLRGGSSVALGQHAAAGNINLVSLEVVAAPNVVELGPWHGSATSRVSRSELRTQLKALVSMELAKLA